MIRTPHFRGGPHRRRYYLYHVVQDRDGYLYGVPYSDLVRPHDGGTYPLADGVCPQTEIVANIGMELWDERSKLPL